VTDPTDSTDSTAQPAGEPPAPTPVLRVVRGHPAPEEVAALLAVVMARTPAATPGSGKVSVWASRARLVRPPLHAGRAAWRTSGWPR